MKLSGKRGTGASGSRRHARSLPSASARSAKPRSSWSGHGTRWPRPASTKRRYGWSAAPSKSHSHRSRRVAAPWRSSSETGWGSRRPPAPCSRPGVGSETAWSVRSPTSFAPRPGGLRSPSVCWVIGSTPSWCATRRQSTRCVLGIRRCNRAHWCSCRWRPVPGGTAGVFSRRT